MFANIIKNKKIFRKIAVKNYVLMIVLVTGFVEIIHAFVKKDFIPKIVL